MKRKLNSLILVLAMVAALLVPCFAAGTPTFEVKAPETLPKKGETFTVTVSISGNTGINAIQMVLGFDKAQVECVKIVQGSVVEDMMVSISNPDAPDGAIVAGADVGDTEADGIIATYTFKALADIESFLFNLNVKVLTNAKGDPVGFTVQKNWKDDINTDTPTDKTDNDDRDADADSGENPGKNVEEENKKTQTDNSSFTDISTHWGKSNILKATELGLFTGYSDGTFRPNANVTRGQFVTVIWRLAGSPTPTAAEPFTDVKDSDYYAKAVAWAYGTGLVNGTSATEFSPNAPLTREAAMKILFLYSGGNMGAELMYYGIYDQCYQDSGVISSWAKAAMYWGVYNSVISGVSSDTIAPKGHATRAQLATILVNYIEKVNVQE